MKPQELVFAGVGPRDLRRREVASSVKHQYDVAPARIDLGTHTGLLRREGRDQVALSARGPDIFDLPVPSEMRLKQLFDLTTAEARLAQRLARGDSVEEVAQSLSIKMTTARTQLAAIFVKTATRRQAKLVAILSRVAHLG
jgi:DNA-binding CsgD family transcriptional regulator